MTPVPFAEHKLIVEVVLRAVEVKGTVDLVVIKLRPLVGDVLLPKVAYNSRYGAN